MDDDVTSVVVFTSVVRLMNGFLRLPAVVSPLSWEGSSGLLKNTQDLSHELLDLSCWVR